MKKTFTFFLALILPFLSFSQGGFENWPLGDNGWHIIDSGINTTEETTIITQGASSASVEVTTGAQASTDLRTKIDVVNGQTYEICFDIYHTEGHLKARIYAGGYYNYSDNDLVNQWQTICKTITATSDGKLEVGLRFYDQAGFDGNEIVYVDDLSVDGITVPIVLASLDAKNINNNTLVSWSTLSETNNDYFSVEWSIDGKSFEEIATINGAGNSREKQEYSYIHSSPKNGVNYYRLTQYDLDGRSKTFNVVSVNIDSDSKTMIIVPNKVENNLKVEFNKPVNNGRLLIFNIEGKMMNSFVLANGIDSFHFNVSNMTSGQYIAKFVDSEGTITKKFIKL